MRLVDRLAARDLLRREAPQGRAVPLRLTARGTRVLHRLPGRSQRAPDAGVTQAVRTARGSPPATPAGALALLHRDLRDGR